MKREEKEKRRVKSVKGVAFGGGAEKARGKDLIVFVRRILHRSRIIIVEKGKKEKKSQKRNRSQEKQEWTVV